MKQHNTYLYLKLSVFYFLVFLLGAGEAAAQERLIKGKVVDFFTGEPITGAVIWGESNKALTQTDADGNFSVTTGSAKIMISFVGYQSENRQVEDFSVTEVLVIKIKESTVELAEVKVRKKRYKNKDNPAVELIRKVIDNKSQNRTSSFENIQYKEHEKIRMGLVNTRDRLIKHPVLKIFPALERSFDSSRVEGKVFLPLYIQEQLFQNYEASSKSAKTLLEEKKVKFDENIFDNQGIQLYMRHLYQPFDIYDNNLMILTNQFVSPISDLGPTFYMYDILDTVTVDSQKFVKMLFTPRNSTDFLFWGDIKIALDSYAVAEINLKVGKGINLNWVKNLEINQRFEQVSNGKFVLEDNNLFIEFLLIPNGRESYLTERLVHFSDYDINKKVDINSIKTNSEVIEKGKGESIGEYSDYDEKIYSTLDSLKDTKRFKTLSNLMNLVIYGYFNVGKSLEAGPVSSFVGYNQLEGMRLRAGLRTMPYFSNKIFLEGYGAYGFKDKRWKYYGAVTYSLTGKNKYVFPMKNITLSYRNDVEIPGNDLRYADDYNSLFSVARGTNDKWLYIKRWNLSYVQEFENRLSYKVGLENTVQTPVGSLVYVKNDQRINDFTIGEIKAEFRYAPHERFYQGKTARSSLTTKYPVYTVRLTSGIDGFLGSSYTYQKINFNIDKRFFLSPIGYTDTSLESSVVLGDNLPFPVLDIMRANQTYTFQDASYNMMNFMEFVSDKFVSAKITHNFNGAILNKIPLLNKLKLREILSLKILYGGLRESNYSRDDTFGFPVDKEGNVSMFSLADKPYIEGGIGIGNILKLFRVDVIKRFTYLNNPNVPNVGFRMRFDFDF